MRTIRCGVNEKRETHQSYGQVNENERLQKIQDNKYFRFIEDEYREISGIKVQPIHD